MSGTCFTCPQTHFPAADRLRFSIDEADGAGGWKRFTANEVERGG